MAWRHRPARDRRARNFPDQPDLVSSLEPESFLRKSFRRNRFQRTRIAIRAWLGRTIRHYQSQRKTERRIAGASANGDRPLEEGSDSAARVSIRSTISVAKTFYPCAGLVSEGPGRRREVAVAQLSGQSALRRPEPVSLVHGQHPSALRCQRLRVLHHASRRVAEEIRSNARRPESARAEANSPAAFRGRRSAKGNERAHRQTGRRKYSGHVIQSPRGQDRQVERAAARGFAKSRRNGDHRPGLSGLSKIDRLFSGASAEDNCRRWRLEITRWRCVLCLCTSLKHDHEHATERSARARFARSDTH